MNGTIEIKPEQKLILVCCVCQPDYQVPEHLKGYEISHGYCKPCKEKLLAELEKLGV